jgi:protoporphyrinogen oxidase
MTKKTAVILGAGPSGLAAAYELLNGGFNAVVLEKTEKVGGIARTENFNGYYFDVGGHRFFTKIEEIRKTWQETLGDDLIRVNRKSRIHYKDRLINYPLNVMNALSNLGAIEGFLVLMSYFKAQILPCGEEENFEQWVSNRFGHRLYETFFQTYTEKVWGIPCNQIGADWAAQRIKGLSLMTALSDALFGGQRAKTLLREFHYPLKGSGMFWQRFCDRIVAKGGEVRLEAEAESLRHEGPYITGIGVVHKGKIGTMPVDQVISTIPLQKLVAILEPRAPGRIIEASLGLAYRSFVMVGLILSRARVFPDQWIYVHDKRVRVGRIQNFKNWSSAMVPDLQKTSLGMEYFCTEGDEIWCMSEDELTHMASEEIGKLGLAHEADVLDSFVVKQPKAYPVYDRSYDKHLGVIREYLEEFANIQTVGRNGMHRYSNMDLAMHSGMLAARNIMGAHHDLWENAGDDNYLEAESRPEHSKIKREKALVQVFARMDKFAFGMAVGTASGLLLFLATIWLILKGGENVGANLQLLSQYFPGYTVTLRGAFVGLGYGLLWGFLMGWFFAYLRNLFIALYAYRVRKRSEWLSLGRFFDQL